MIDTIAFSIGNIPVKSPLIMAPMDGFTDMPFRRIVKRLGAGIVFSEFINGLDVINKHPHLEEKITFSEDERPFAYQIFDDFPERILETALILEEKKPDFIDINIGCSAKNVANRGAGAGLLRHPEKIKRIFNLIQNRLTIPVTAKIRLGWDENTMNYLEIAKILQDNGAAMISVHGRTKIQSYSGKANWHAIAEIKRALTIPVIANGDVVRQTDIKKIMETTGCNGVMIGRGALLNPWIFQGKDLSEIPAVERIDLFNQHFESVLVFYGIRSGMILFRKHIKNYFNIQSITREERINLYTQKDPAVFKNLFLKEMKTHLEVY